MAGYAAAADELLRRRARQEARQVFLGGRQARGGICDGGCRESNAVRGHGNKPPRPGGGWEAPGAGPATPSRMRATSDGDHRIWFAACSSMAS